MYKLHLATKEYCFIEFSDEGTPEEAVNKYIELEGEWMKSDQVGLNANEWSRVRNNYIINNVIEPDDFGSLSKAQKFVINEIKKAFKSIKK